MCRFLTPFPCLLTVLLTGCPSAPPVAEAESGLIPALEIVGSADLFSGGVGFLALSEDGNTFIAGNENRGVGLYRTSDHAPLERHYECEGEALATPDGAYSCNERVSIYDLGYIDANTWYFTAMAFKENDMRVHVRTIHPPQEISVSTVNELTHRAIASTNRNYIAYNNELIDWRTGKRYPTKATVFEPKWPTFPTVTPDNRIITYPGRKTVIFDPLNDTMESWKEAARLDETIIVTPDNRHAIGLSTANYKCTLWNWPERKKIGHCSERLRGIFGGYPEYLEVLTLSHDGKFFAIGVDNSVRVYRVEPFKLELEVSTPGPVNTLALSDDGLLAAYDYKGFLRVWDVAIGSLAGQHKFLDVGWAGMTGYKLLFQPNSNKLFIKRGGITVFEIPKQAAQQKAKNDSGTRTEDEKWRGRR
ncbi:MAG: WD40 repeat domain-containing protein [Azoarcus sp.]|nr:WD40 repeat domain-containing protein [Azoarcus sp.]